jgi:muconolactone D-isomerase
MEFLLSMTAAVPEGFPDDELARIYTAERARGTELLGAGVFQRMWRRAGTGEAIILFNAEDEDAAAALVAAMPIAPLAEIAITPLVTHPLELAAHGEGTEQPA